MSQVNTDLIKKAFAALKDSLFKTFDETPNAVKIITEKSGRKKTIDLNQLFQEAGLTELPSYRAVTSIATNTKKPKPKSTDLESLSDAGDKIEVEEPLTPVDNIPTNEHFDIIDIYDKQLIGIRFYEPTAANHRLTICLDFLPPDVLEDPKRLKTARPALMIITFTLPNRGKRRS